MMSEFPEPWNRDEKRRSYEYELGVGFGQELERLARQAGMRVPAADEMDSHSFFHPLCLPFTSTCLLHVRAWGWHP